MIWRHLAPPVICCQMLSNRWAGSVKEPVPFVKRLVKSKKNIVFF